MPSRNRSRAGKSPTTRDIATENYEAGYNLVAAHPMLGLLLRSAWVIREKRSRCPEDGWAIVTSSGRIYVHPTRRGSPEEWAYVLAHCLLHLGFNHFLNTASPDVWNTACDCYLASFLARLKFGRPPEDMLVSAEMPAGSEQRIYDQLHERGIRPEQVAPGTAGKHPDLIFDLTGESLKKSSERWAHIMGEALVRAVTSSVEVAAGIRPALGGSAQKPRTLAQQARSWFISSYPLLGALAASFTLIEDPLLCTRMGISVAAVHAESKEIYINPNAGLNQQQYRFVLAHELLHVGLRHETRRQGRDPYFWNVSCFPAGTWLGEGHPIEQNATMERTYQGDLLTIDTQAGQISCTPEHPFFARSRVGRSYPIQITEPGWREAKTLGVGDYLLVPKLQHTRTDTVIDLSDHIREGADSLGRHTFANRAIKEIALNVDTAWLIGLYVAEGNSSPGVCLSLSATETAIAAKAARIFNQIGYSATTQVADTRLRVSTGAVVLGRWLKQECGGSAKTKHIPRVILYHGDAKIRAAFLDGLVTGDGHTRKQTTSSTTICMVGSVSERLMSDLALLLAQDGIGGARGILKRGPRQIGKTWTNKELVLHTLHWNPAGVAQTPRTMNGRTILSNSQRWRADQHGVWYRVKSVSATPFSGQVYNLTTTEHTYIANGFLVHNCDYVINAWLIEMGVGELPPLGLLYDPDLKGLSAEAIYDRIVTDIRRFRKLHTLRGVDSGDILDSAEVEWWTLQNGADLDEFYRRALSQGLEYHYEQGRGFLPGGLVEEIRALAQPPIAWDVELAQWFDHHFPLPEKIRSYARPHRHQSATPDIPRPSWVLPPDWDDGRTFGVLLDTSGSMDRVALAKALGAIASYSIAREVPAVRLVFCDAATYDEGYVSPEDIAGRVRVRGRGGTILQPGVDLLERAPDFPKDGPLLIITDGLCDMLHIRREHAFLLPQGRHLPFVAKGEIFYIS